MSNEVPQNLLIRFKYLKNVKMALLIHLKEILPVENGLYGITNDDLVMAIGENIDGELGVGHTRKLIDFEAITELSKQNIIDIVSNEGFTAARNAHGFVWIWGRKYDLNDEKDRGHVYLKRPLKLNLNDVVSISVGRHGLALTSNGTVYGWGNNTFGQLGLGARSRFQHSAMLVNSPWGELVTQVECGRFQSWIITQSGRLFGFGYNVNMNLGLSSVNYEKIVNVPTEVFIPNELVRQVTSSGEFSLFLTENGHVYATLGLYRMTQIPFKIEMPNNNICGLLSNCYLDLDQTVPAEYIWMQATFYFIDKNQNVFISGDLIDGTHEVKPTYKLNAIVEGVLKFSHKQISPTLLTIIPKIYPLHIVNTEKTNN